MSSNNQNGPGKIKPKKAYRSPALQVYGNIRALTNSAGNMSLMADTGMVVGMTKTG